MLVLLARTKESLKRQVDDLHSRGMDARGHATGAAKKKSLAVAFAPLEADFGAPEVLVRNAGANTISKPSELAEENLLRDFTCKVVGAGNASQLVIPAMAERGAGTTLVHRQHAWRESRCLKGVRLRCQGGPAKSGLHAVRGIGPAGHQAPAPSPLPVFSSPGPSLTLA